MSPNNYPEAHKLILFLEKTPLSVEEKTRLTELLNTNGMTEETTGTVREALTALPKEAFKDDWQRAKFMMDFASLLKQWQMSLGSKKFKHAKN